MAATCRINKGSARKARRSSILFAAAVLIPGAAIFCLHLNRQSRLAESGITSDQIRLNSKEASRSPGSWISDFLRTSSRHDPNGIVLRNPDNPYRGSMSREMLSAQADPFLAALASGVSEGVLVPRGRTDGVRTLGPPLPKGGSRSFSDQEMLALVRTGVGGSFRTLFADLLGGRQRESNVAATNQHDENPFAKALESLAENARSGDKPPAETKADAPPAKEQSSTGTASEAATPSPTPITTGPSSRSNLLLSVDDDGTLRAVQVGPLHDGAVSSADLGITDLPLLRFSNTADFGANILVADFNGDGVADVAYFAPMQGQLRFFYGSQDGSFSEDLRIDIGKAPRVLAAGDFDHDGQMDIAVSAEGSGIVTVLFGDSGSYRFKSFYSDAYRDYILAADTTGTGNLDLLGMTYNNSGTVLVDFSQGNGVTTNKSFDYTPSLNSLITTSSGFDAHLNAVVLSSNMSLNLDNQQNQMMHVLNVLGSTRTYVVIGDLYQDGRLVVGIAIPHP